MRKFFSGSFIRGVFLIYCCRCRTNNEFGDRQNNKLTPYEVLFMQAFKTH